MLVLQYPDPNECGFKTLAATHNRRAMLAFRDAVLAEAARKVIESLPDEVLRVEYEADFERLQKVLDLLIPAEVGEDEDSSR